MFWSSVKKQQDAITTSVNPVTRAFTVQMDEVRRLCNIAESQWDEMEVFAFVMWVYHMGIMNSGRPVDGIRPLQETLNNAANEFVFRYLAAHPSFSFMPPEQRKHIHQIIIENVQRRAFDYNEAFNRDKIRATQPDTLYPNFYQNKRLLDHVVQDTQMRQRMAGSEAMMLMVTTQLFEQVYGIFGIKFGKAA